MVISENFVWFTNENNRRLNVKVISSYINEREENFPYQKLLQKQKQKTTQKWTFWEFLFFFSRPSPFQFLIKTKLWPEYLDQRIKSKEILVLNICEEITIIIDSEVMEFRLLTTKVNTTSACECWWKNSERKNSQGRKTISLRNQIYCHIVSKTAF